ncbi:hypothetical protein AJ79_00758 [Helicocarpus griseus UAMH5409]|uniref:Amine oxidase n=1 Tax=Helicocarpus griseus UAMH5409 TaxID=1447875 RepID=A0A2B7YAA8_9EURO|nr:hypothetical protein AJ79_00758 [Helicocarpus griseus UAMH5409]
MAPPHPFDPLSPQEISLAVKYIKDAYPGHNVIFRVVTLAEPSKAQMIPYLQAERLAVSSSKPPAVVPRPRRIAHVQFYLGDSSDFREVRVDLGSGERLEESKLEGKHSYLDETLMQACEKACLADQGVREAIELLELPEGAVVCVEPWTYGTDGMRDMSRRLIMCYLYMRLSSHGDANHYAYPLDLCVEMTDELEVLGIFNLPSGVDDRYTPVTEGVRKFDRSKIHGSSEYHPDLVPDRRTSTKPYQVVQPDGPSFHTDGNLITWEKWRMRVGFNYREGLTLHDITYDGRSVFYRLSLSEMFVPYGDSRAPFPRKAAFDLGSNGAGVNANNLKLGCDCLGNIKYFDAYLHNTFGDPVKFPNVICCHEIDDGILWKHTNYRTGNAVVTRSRILVLQTIITVGNYEYIFAFHFTQDACINYEVRATGILSTTPINKGDSVPYGTLVAPGVLAPYHQHLFSLRIDPAIDGYENSLVVEDSIPMPLDDPKIHNPFGIGYTTTKETIETETPLGTDITKARIFKIINENVRNPVNNMPVGYKLVPHYSQMLLAHPSSLHAKRSEFCSHPLWVTRYSDRELYSSGDHTMQSFGGEGIASWIKSRASSPASNVRNQDIVLWHTFGTTHNPRIEDWPVMPAEKMLVSLKPVNFFTGNPAVDVPVSTQEKNKSVLVDDGERNN